VTINITPVNDPPAAVNDTYVAAENYPLTVATPGVLGNDSDVDGNSLTAVLDVAPTTGELTLNSNGSFVYTPTLDSTGVVAFTYHASDGSLDSEVAQVVITVTEYIADLALSKEVSNPTPDEGETIVYTLIITNYGPDQATGVWVSDLLPAGVTYVSDDGEGSYDPDSGMWAVGSLDVDESATLLITVTINSVTSDTAITNTATIRAADQADIAPSNNTDQAVITVEMGWIQVYMPLVLK
jgi:uncharacterized repeat protein (TIGR01451 family)